jgi:hypothetical protein
VVLLASLLFLISAPAPDASDIAEFTSNFIVPGKIPGLLVAETGLQPVHGSSLIASLSNPSRKLLNSNLNSS